MKLDLFNLLQGNGVHAVNGVATQTRIDVEALGLMVLGPSGGESVIHTLNSFSMN